MIDIEGYNKIEKQARKCKDLLDAGLYSEATNQWGLTEDEIDAVTFHIDIYNILTKIEIEEQRNNSQFFDGLSTYFQKY